MWKVCPIQGKQLLDVREEDLLSNGLFRKCNTYRGGGGYDKFPAICKKRLNKELFNQFVVQLYGCPFKCPYCYVTNEGIWGKYQEISTEQLLLEFKKSEQDIFHLMGGAPALYLEKWQEILNNFPEDKVFHSDFLLLEKPYQKEWVQNISPKNTLFAVSIKGVTDREFYQNTGANISWNLFRNNLDLLVENNINFYFTFTNISEDSDDLKLFKDTLQMRYGDSILNDCFCIPLIKYDALK